MHFSWCMSHFLGALVMQYQLFPMATFEAPEPFATQALTFVVIGCRAVKPRWLFGGRIVIAV